MYWHKDRDQPLLYFHIQSDDPINFSSILATSDVPLGLSPCAFPSTAEDPLLQAVVIHQEYLAGRARYSILRKASAILEKILGLVLTHQGIQQEGKTLRPGRVVGLLKNAQTKHQTSHLCEKIIHGEFSVSARRTNGMSKGATSGYG